MQARLDGHTQTTDSLWTQAETDVKRKEAAEKELATKGEELTAVNTKKTAALEKLTKHKNDVQASKDIIKDMEAKHEKLRKEKEDLQDLQTTMVADAKRFHGVK